MPFELPSLPFDSSALEPYISAQTLAFHHGKHHQAYITNLNALIKETEFENDTLEEIIEFTANQIDKASIFNNAAQVYNHSFFWNCLTPNSTKDIPDGAFKTAVPESFSTPEDFKETLKKAALTQFGSGWAWVIKDKEKIDIIKTSNADTPIAHHLKPLFTIDVWEHAYYLDYQNKRPEYVENILDHLINWDFVEKNFSLI